MGQEDTVPASSGITLRSPTQIEAMAHAGQLVAKALKLACSMVAPGVTTGEIDRAVEQLFDQHNAIPLFRDYPHPSGKAPFPAVTCISVNDQVVHGVPGPRELVAGDVITIDTGCQLDGWCGDSAVTIPVGAVSESSQQLLDVGAATLDLAIEQLAHCEMWSGVARQLDQFVAAQGCQMVDQFVGHGIGRRMHEPPEVPNVCPRNWWADDFRIEPGLVIAIEPMVSLGTKDVKTLADDWTVATCDGSYAAHFEHTVAMTPSGPRILTAREAD